MSNSLSQIEAKTMRPVYVRERVGSRTSGSSPMPIRRWLCAKAPVAASERAVAKSTRRTNSLMVSSRSGGGSVNPVQIVIVVGVFGRAEFAFHGDAAGLVAQVVELFALDAAQHVIDALATAAAARKQRSVLELARLILVEQTIEQGGVEQVRVEHLGLGGRRHEDDRLAPVVLALFGVDFHAAGVEFRHLLDHQRRGAP